MQSSSSLLSPDDYLQFAVEMLRDKREKGNLPRQNVSTRYSAPRVHNLAYRGNKLFQYTGVHEQFNLKIFRDICCFCDAGKCDAFCRGRRRTGISAVCDLGVEIPSPSASCGYEIFRVCETLLNILPAVDQNCSSVRRRLLRQYRIQTSLLCSTK